MSSGKTVINMSIICWCCVVLIELCIIAWLIPSGLVLLFAVVLIPPIWAALSWPAPAQITEGEAKTTEVAAEKA